MKHSRVIIIGFGPSGMACAIQLKRMGLTPSVIEKSRPGGMLSNANLIENYLGFPKGIPGSKLAEIFREQAYNYNINAIKDDINEIRYSNSTFYLKGNSDEYTCDKLVIASGTLPKWPENLPPGLIHSGLVHADITLLGQISSKSIGIIGAGDAAFDYALSLAQRGNSVMIFNRGTEVKALLRLQEKVSKANYISYFENYSLENARIIDGKILSLSFTENMQEHEFIVDYLIFATGRVPALNFLDPEMNHKLDSLREDHRLYLIGDVKNGIFRQLSLAVGDGIKAAMDIYNHESNHPD
jgi:thioredoxin reductase (NADPH)